MNGTEIAFAGPMPSLSDSDVAVLQFLAVAELVESDLWGQYCELATKQSRLPQCPSKDRRIASRLHLWGIGRRAQPCHLHQCIPRRCRKTPINLDPSAPCPASRRGAKNFGRLTNLKNLTVDTSYYQRYRRAGNPDFGDAFAQIANIVNQPTVPTSESIGGDKLRSIAQTAAFHFASIEQGGSSLYNSFMTKVTNLDVVAILASIGPWRSTTSRLPNGS